MGRALVALLMATSTRLAQGLVGEGAVSVARARRVAPLCAVAPPVQVAAADDPLVKLANEFIYEKSGFYSPYAADAFADDFVFRGPVIGPLNKADYLSTMDTFKVYMASDVGECYNKLYGKEGKTSRAAMELDAQSDRCNEDVDEKTKTVVSCCLKVDEALARCARLPCFPGTCNLNRDIC